MLLKKAVYDKLVAKLNNIDTNNFVLKTKYETDKSELKNKIPAVSNLVKKTDFNTKITEIEKKLTDHNHDQYIDTQEFDKLAADVFNVRIAQTNLITKTNVDAKFSSLYRKITSNKTKHLLVENELNKVKTFDSSYFIGKSHFEEDGTQI